MTGNVAFDSIAALLVAGAIVATGVRLARRSGRVLMDEALPDEELDRIERVIAVSRLPEVAGYHKLRGRSAGSQSPHRPARPVSGRHQPRGGPPAGA